MKTRALISQRGSVLVAVLVVCLGLVSVALLFAGSSMMNYRGTGNDLAGRQAEHALEGGARYAMYLLSTLETKGTLPDPTTYEPDDLPVGEGAFWFLGRTTDETQNVTEPEFGLVDEASKLNLNTATEEMLLKLPGMTEELAAAIVAWRTVGDSTVTDTYQSRSPGYHRKAAKFESIEELALLDGADLSILEGKDHNRNGVVDTEENDSQPSLEAMDFSTVDGPGIYEYVTVFSRELNPATKTDGTARPLATDLSALSGYLAGTDKLQSGRGAAIIVALAGEAPKSALELLIRGTMTEDELTAIEGDLRFSEATELHLINVNTASATVLACIPGLEDVAQEIVSARLNRDPASTSIAWLKEYLKDSEQAKRAGPFITGKTFVVCADVAAVGQHGRGYRRTRFIIDSTGSTPKIVYRRNLGGLGWALGREVRALLDDERGTR